MRIALSVPFRRFPSLCCVCFRNVRAHVCSYDWFEAQRHLYPEIVLPGTHLVGANTRKHLNGGFTMDELITANVDDHALYVHHAIAQRKGTDPLS